MSRKAKILALRSSSFVACALHHTLKGVGMLLLKVEDFDPLARNADISILYLDHTFHRWIGIDLVLCAKEMRLV